MLTTKMPGAAVLMQLSTILADRNLWLDLQWKERSLNQEADDLTNDVFDRLDMKNRIYVV